MFFSWNREPDEIKQVISLSRRFSSFRNKILGLPSSFGFLIEKNFDICYTSLSCYPPNGGFLKRHKDSYRDVDDIVHFKIELTHLEQDYDSGGMLVQSKGGEFINVSKLSRPGDVIFFSGLQSQRYCQHMEAK